MYDYKIKYIYIIYVFILNFHENEIFQENEFNDTLKS